MIGQEARQAAEAALRRLDRILAERPREVHEDLSDAVRDIVALRDDLIRSLRSGQAGPGMRDRLDHANRLVSVAIGAEFPVTGLHWERIETTRGLLRKLLDRG
jgi:hypothetical protein